jgi:hypothetical protein
MVDTLDVLRTLRLHNGIEDAGEHLAYNLMNHINTFRNKHYFDETNNEYGMDGPFVEILGLENPQLELMKLPYPDTSPLIQNYQ